MGRSIEKLTKLRVEGYSAPPKGQEFHWDSELRGFGVGVAAGGSRTYVAQTRVNGKSVRIKIGRHGRWTCDQARTSARELLLSMDKGVDPREEKRKQKAQGVTLREVMDDYIANKKTKRGPLAERSKWDIKRHVTNTFKTWADQPVKNITPEACRKHFAEMSATKPTHANQAYRILRALLNYARKSSKTNEGVVTLLPENPVSVISDRSMWNAEHPRDRRIPLNRIGAVWALLQQLRTAGNQTPASRTGADLVSFVMLTSARRGEASTLTWEQVNLEDDFGTWHLPDPKNRLPITRPLSKVARELLAARYAMRDESSPYVFPGRYDGSEPVNNAETTLRKIAKVAAVKVSLHDLRRTFADVAEEVGIDYHHVKRLLGHVATDVTGRHYANNRDPRKLLPAVDAIATYLAEQAAMAEGKNVIALRA